MQERNNCKSSTYFRWGEKFIIGKLSGVTDFYKRIPKPTTLVEQPRGD